MFGGLPLGPNPFSTGSATPTNTNSTAVPEGSPYNAPLAGWQAGGAPPFGLSGPTQQQQQPQSWAKTMGGAGGGKSGGNNNNTQGNGRRGGSGGNQQQLAAGAGSGGNNNNNNIANNNNGHPSQKGGACGAAASWSAATPPWTGSTFSGPAAPFNTLLNPKNRPKNAQEQLFGEPNSAGGKPHQREQKGGSGGRREQGGRRQWQAQR